MYTEDEAKQFARAMLGSAFVEAERAEAAERARKVAVDEFSAHKASLVSRRDALDSAYGTARRASGGRQTREVVTTSAAFAEIASVTKGLSPSPSMGVK